jgi:hypothetical protein
MDGREIPAMAVAEALAPLSEEDGELDLDLCAQDMVAGSVGWSQGQAGRSLTSFEDGLKDQGEIRCTTLYGALLLAS